VWRRSRAFFGLAAYRLETSETIRHGSPLLAGRIEGGALGQMHAFGKRAPRFDDHIILSSYARWRQLSNETPAA
jgi:hypothetical protein